MFKRFSLVCSALLLSTLLSGCIYHDHYHGGRHHGHHDHGRHNGHHR
ncbi:MAG: hypothetical protein E6560_08000 [Yersiniaceae bacterium]|nr:hypothetical protein [Chimaeribacter coloradensis]MDU6410893.1 hypothetical protein [Yersiniaceae bacterium]